MDLLVYSVVTGKTFFSLIPCLTQIFFIVITNLSLKTSLIDRNQSASSVWLTAYSVRVLQEASFYEWENYIYIDPEVISKAVAWILDHQTWEGAFYEVTWFPDRKVNDSLHWPDDHVRSRNISLTAHVLITLETVKDLTGVCLSACFIQEFSVNRIY